MAAEIQGAVEQQARCLQSGGRGFAEQLVVSINGNSHLPFYL
jgi:hypothetical protein